jgi:hypothetical protein
MMFDKKRVMQTIMARRRPDKGGGDLAANPTTEMKNEIVRDEDGAPDARHIAAQDVMNAFHEKSPEKLKSALGNFIDLHHAEAEPEPQE